MVATCTVREAGLPNVLLVNIPMTRKVILPLASVVGAGVLAVATGLLSGGASAASDGVRLTSDEDGDAVLAVSALEPGDSVTRTVTISNTTGDAARLTFTEHGEQATFADGELALVIDRDGHEVYDGAFGAMSDFAQDMGDLAAGQSATFSFTVSLPDDARYIAPGDETAEATYSWLITTP